MKQGHSSSIDRVFNFIILILPLLILVPRTNVPADPTLPKHLPSQEFAHSLAVSLLVFLGLLKFWRQKISLSFTRPQIALFVALGIFCVWQFITLFWSPDFAEGYRVTSLWVCFGVILFFGLSNIEDETRDRLYLSFSIAMTLLALYQTFLYFQFGLDFTGLLYSFYLKTELLTLFIPLQIVVFLTAKNIARIYFALFSLCIAWLAELQLFKRGPLIGIIISLILLSFGMFIYRKSFSFSYRRMIVLASCFLFIAASQIYLQRTYFQNRLDDATNLNSPTQVSEVYNRLYYAAVAWEAFKSKPIQGDGVGAYNADFAKYRQAYVSNPSYTKLRSVSNPKTDATQFHARSTNAHNEFLQILGETGLIGFSLFIIVWLLLFFLLWQLRTVAPMQMVAALCGLIAYFISSSVTSFSFRASPGIVSVACLLLMTLGSNTRSIRQDKSTVYRLKRSYSLILFVVLISLNLIWNYRTFSVLRSYQIEAPLDFNYFPDEPQKNEQLLSNYQQVFSLDPLNAGAHLSCGILLFQMKRPQEAIPHLEFAISHGFNRPWATASLAFVYEQTRDIDKAINTMNETVKAYPDSIFSRVIYAFFLKQKGRVDDYREQLRLLPKDSVNNNETRCWEIALRMKPVDAMAELKRQNLPPLESLTPLDKDNLQQLMVQIRGFFYL